MSTTTTPTTTTTNNALFTAEDAIEILGLQPHPEGGYFKETFRDTATINNDASSSSGGGRSISTSIYYLLKSGQCSALHRIDAAEGWHHYAGGVLNVVELPLSSSITASEAGAANSGGENSQKSESESAVTAPPTVTRVGPNILVGDCPQYVVGAGRWFGAEADAGSAWVLVGCTVAPAFEFSTFELGQRDKLMAEFGHNKECRHWIEKLTPAPASESD